MSRPSVRTLCWTTTGLAVALLGLVLSRAWHGAIISVVMLDHAGWSSLVHQPVGHPTTWLLGCVLIPGCPQAFAGVWVAHTPRWEVAAWVIMVYASALFRILTGRARSHSDLPPGAARWAQPHELRPFLHGESASPQRGYLGVLAPASMASRWSRHAPILRLPERLRCSHCLVVGGSGARKTTGYHKPNVLLDAMDGVSVAIFDLKYPDSTSGFWDCVPWFATHGFDVQLFLPFEPQTLALPLLGAVQSLEDAYDVVDLLLPPSLQEHAANFYRDQERQLLVGLILGITRDGLRSRKDSFAGPPSLRRLFRLCLTGISEIERYVHTHPDPQVRDAIAGLFDLEPRLLAGIAAGVAGRLQLFNDDRLDRATTEPADPRAAVRPEQLGVAPTLLYIGIPQERVQGARGQLVLQLVKRTIDRALLRTADRFGGALPRHVSIYLDEFAAMGPLPHVSETMATMRSRRVAYHLSLQNRAQGEMLYGMTGFRSFFVNNIQTVIIFPRYLKFDDAQYFSEMLGYMTVEQRSTGLTRRGLFGGSRTDWARDALRPLVPPEEYPDWPEAMGILFTIGARPVRILLPRLDEPHAGGVRNPLAGFRSRLSIAGGEGMRTQLLTQLVGYHRTWTDLHPTFTSQEADRASAPARSTTSPVPPEPFDGASVPSEVSGSTPVHPSSPPARPSHIGFGAVEIAQTVAVPGPELVASLRQWINEVIQRGLPLGAVKPYAHNGRLTRLGLYRMALPDELSLPSQLSAWMAQRWVRVTPVEIGLLPRALQLLPREVITTLRRAAAQRSTARVPTVQPNSSRLPEPLPTPQASLPEPAPVASQQKHGGDLSALASEAIHQLRVWVDAHGTGMEGHPQRDPHAASQGVYRPGHAVIVPAATVRQVLAAAGVPPQRMAQIRAAWREAGWIRADQHRLTTVRRVGDARRRVVEILWDAWTAPEPPNPLDPLTAVHGHDGGSHHATPQA